MKTSSQSWPTVSRIIAAIVGGYFFTYAFTAAFARLLPFDKVDALVTASVSSFLVYTLVILWVFSCHSVWRVWAGLTLALPLGAFGFWPQWLEQL